MKAGNTREENRLNSMTDAQLARLSQRGDRQAFGFLARRWDGRLFRFLHRMLGDAEDARDACQDTFLKAYMNIGGLREPEHFKAWIHRIAVNLCRDRYRRAKYDTVELAAPGDENGKERLEPVEEGPNPLQEAERSDAASILRRTLARLPLEQRTAILLREVQGFTAEEIARITGVPAATTRSRIFYGLKALRRLLPEQGITGAKMH
jgi:RNA polymerase sigma-70 factor (ECF subfamily)